MPLDQTSDAIFPCALTLFVPFPNYTIASTVLHALNVDDELSPLVRRRLDVCSGGSTATGPDGGEEPGKIQVQFRATTNRMLRVAVNAFMESLKLVVEVTEKLDVDVLEAARPRQMPEEIGSAVAAPS